MSKKREQVFHYPEDCEYYVTSMDKLNEEVRMQLEVDGKCFRKHYVVEYRGRHLADWMVNEFFFKISSQLARVIYSLVDISDEDDWSVLEEGIKLGWQFRYLALNKDSIEDAVFNRIAPIMKQMQENDDGFLGALYIEMEEGYCYYNVVPQSETDKDVFWEYFETITKEARKLTYYIIHQKGFSEMMDGQSTHDFFFYDNLSLFELPLKEFELSDDDKNQLLETGELTYKIRLYSDDYSDGYELLEIVDDPFSIGDICVFSYGIFFWGHVSEWVCGLANTMDGLISYGDHIDSYDLEKKAPTLYMLLQNARQKRLDCGALFLIPGKSFFLCQYSPDLSDAEQEKLHRNCRQTVYRAMDEAERYSEHLVLTRRKEEKRKDDSSSGFIGRYTLMECIRTLLS